MLFLDINFECLNLLTQLHHRQHQLQHQWQQQQSRALRQITEEFTIIVPLYCRGLLNGIYVNCKLKIPNAVTRWVNYFTVFFVFIFFCFFLSKIRNKINNVSNVLRVAGRKTESTRCGTIWKWFGLKMRLNFSSRWYTNVPQFGSKCTGCPQLYAIASCQLCISYVRLLNISWGKYAWWVRCVCVFVIKESSTAVPTHKRNKLLVLLIPLFSILTATRARVVPPKHTAILSFFMTVSCTRSHITDRHRETHINICGCPKLRRWENEKANGRERERKNETVSERRTIQNWNAK